jgi:hypothetical protein
MRIKAAAVLDPNNVPMNNGLGMPVVRAGATRD